MHGGTKQLMILVFGESGVGKTCFTDMFLTGKHFSNYDPSAAADRKIIQVDGVPTNIHPIDLDSSACRAPEIGAIMSEFYANFLRSSRGLILLYDITDKTSYDYITTNAYLQFITTRNDCSDEGIPYPCGMQRFGCVLVGTKADLASEKRAVDREVAQEWADSQGIKFFELDKFEADAIHSVMVAVSRSVMKAEKRDLEDIESVKKGDKKNRMSGLMQSIRKIVISDGRRQSHD